MEIRRSSIPSESSASRTAGPGQASAIGQSDHLSTIFSLGNWTAGLRDLLMGAPKEGQNPLRHDPPNKAVSSPFIGTETDSVKHLASAAGENIQTFKASLSETLSLMDTISVTQTDEGIVALNPQFANLAVALEMTLEAGAQFSPSERTGVLETLDTKYEDQTPRQLVDTVISKLKSSDFEAIQSLGNALEAFVSSPVQAGIGHPPDNDDGPSLPNALGSQLLITNGTDIPPAPLQAPESAWRFDPYPASASNGREITFWSLPHDGDEPAPPPNGEDRSISRGLQTLRSVQQDLMTTIQRDPNQLAQLFRPGHNVTATDVANIALQYAGPNAADVKSWFEGQPQYVQRTIMDGFQRIADSANQSPRRLTDHQSPIQEAVLGVGHHVLPEDAVTNEMGSSGLKRTDDSLTNGRDSLRFGTPKHLNPRNVKSHERPESKTGSNPYRVPIFTDDISLQPDETSIALTSHQPRVLSREELIAAIKKDKDMAPNTRSALLTVISSQNILPNASSFKLALSRELRKTSPLEGFKQEALGTQLAQAMTFLGTFDNIHGGLIEDSPSVASERSEPSVEVSEIDHLRQQLVTNPAKTKDLLHNLVALRRAHDTVINRGKEDPSDLDHVMQSLQTTCNAVKVALADRAPLTKSEGSTSEDPETKLMHDFQVSAETILKCLETANPKISGALQIAMLYSVTASLDQLIDSSVGGNKLQFKADIPAMTTIEASAPDTNISLLEKPYARESSTVFSILYDTNIDTKKIAIKAHDGFDFPDHMMGDSIAFHQIIIRSAQEAGITNSISPISIDSAKHWMMTIGTALTSPTTDGLHLDSGHVALGTKILDGIRDWSPSDVSHRSLDEWVEQFKTDKMTNEDDKSVCERFHNELKKAALPGSPGSVSTNFDELD